MISQKSQTMKSKFKYCITLVTSIFFLQTVMFRYYFHSRSLKIILIESTILEHPNHIKPGHRLFHFSVKDRSRKNCFVNCNCTVFKQGLLQKDNIKNIFLNDGIQFQPENCIPENGVELFSGHHLFWAIKLRHEFSEYLLSKFQMINISYYKTRNVLPELTTKESLPSCSFNVAQPECLRMIMAKTKNMKSNLICISVFTLNRQYSLSRRLRPSSAQ